MFFGFDGIEIWMGIFDVGIYVIEIYDCNNVSCGVVVVGDSCFDFIVN